MIDNCYNNIDACMMKFNKFRIRIVFIGIRKDLHFTEDNIGPTPFLFGKEQITIEQAIMDLPQINSGEGKEFIEYSKKPKSDYQKWARNNSNGVYNHIAMRHTKRLIERFKNIDFGS